jgi:hypothetical protein
MTWIFVIAAVLVLLLVLNRWGEKLQRQRQAILEAERYFLSQTITEAIAALGASDAKQVTIGDRTFYSWGHGSNRVTLIANKQDIVCDYVPAYFPSEAVIWIPQHQPELLLGKSIDEVVKLIGNYDQDYHWDFGVFEYEWHLDDGRKVSLWFRHSRCETVEIHVPDEKT